MYRLSAANNSLKCVICKTASSKSYGILVEVTNTAVSHFVCLHMRILVAGFEFAPVKHIAMHVLITAGVDLDQWSSSEER